MNTQIDNLPLFPLPILLFPKQQETLHIFEFRYKVLVNYLEKGNQLFGIPVFNQANEFLGGSLVKLVDVTKRFSDGRCNIIVECTHNFKLLTFSDKLTHFPFPGGDIEILHTYKNELNFDVVENYWKFLRLSTETHLELYKLKSKKWFDVAADLNLTLSEKIKLINLNSFKKKQDYIHQKISYLNLLLKQEISIENNIYLN